MQNPFLLYVPDGQELTQISLNLYWLFGHPSGLIVQILPVRIEPIWQDVHFWGPVQERQLIGQHVQTLVSKSG